MKWMAMAIVLLCAAATAQAQLGGLAKAIQKADEVKQKVDELAVSEAEERQIGEDVSQKIRDKFGVVQDPAVHKYVTLVGMTLAKQSDRPNLAWTFVVLDTDGVNAFAAPGGIIHVTRGALGFAKNEAELAGILGHEIGHVAHKHTVNAIQKSKAIQMGSNAVGSRSTVLAQITDRAYAMVFENSFDRSDELDADMVAVQLAQKAGYAPKALGDFLTRLDDRNRAQMTKNGMFASHPATKERIDKITQQAGKTNAAVLVEARYKTNITYQPMAITTIATVTDGSKGLAEGKAAPKKDEPKEEPKKKGFGIGSLTQVVAPEKQSTQVAASGGARGLEPDKDAPGGPVKTLVRVTVTSAELDTFKRGIV
jgi:predicted Zn-dependent protease